MAELAQAYVQIIPSAEGIKGKLTNLLGGEASSAGKSAGESVGSNLVSTLKTVVAAAGIGKIISDALTAGGDLQQSFGGLDTLYGDASTAAKNYAREAASAGISANDYAEQAVSFGAALKSAFGGDVTKAAESANTAIMDMADNSAKMGTDINSVQAAYQGFAKQNYTLLDNLKIGYGGTKTEMERLLSDATKLTGVKYDISNLGDVYEAIHVIQGDLGLTGVAAEEASTTFTGSFGAMKAAAQNFLADLALGNDVTTSLQTLMSTAATFVINNLAPMALNIATAIPAVVQTLMDTVTAQLPTVMMSITNLITQATEAIKTFDWTLTGSTTITNFVTAITSNLPQLLTAAGNLIATLAQGILDHLPEMITKGGEVVVNLLSGILTELPNVLTQGGEIIVNLISGITNAAPGVLSAIGQVMANLITTILQKGPEVLSTGVETVGKIVQGIINSLPKLGTAAGQMASKVITTITNNGPQFLEQGITLLGKIVAGIIQAIPKIVSAATQCITNFKKQFSSMDWKSIGSQIINGIVNGLKAGVGEIISAARDAAQSALDAAKSALGIHSPSKVMRDQVGKMIGEGLALGIGDSTGAIDSAMQDAVDSMNGSTANATLAIGYNSSALSGQVSTEADRLSTIEKLLEQIGNTMSGQNNGLQVVLDTGTLVGSIAAPMDTALGSLYKKRSR